MCWVNLTKMVCSCIVVKTWCVLKISPYPLMNLSISLDESLGGNWRCTLKNKQSWVRTDHARKKNIQFCLHHKCNIIISLWAKLSIVFIFAFKHGWLKSTLLLQLLFYENSIRLYVLCMHVYNIVFVCCKCNSSL